MTTPTTSDTLATDQAAAGPSYSLADLVRYFLKLGALGFGGPVALVGYMNRDLVESRKWISQADYKEGLTLAQLAPGPLAAQLAIYLGYVHYRTWGATLAGVAFVAPSFLMVVALGWAYTLYGGLSWMQAVFYGVGSCVIGIITYSAYKLTKKTIGKDWLLCAICFASAACTVVTETEYVALFLLAGVLVWFVKSPPKFRARPKTAASAILPLAAFWCFEINGETQTLLQIMLFFTKAGAFVFGSGLAIVPFLYSVVVNEYHWLDNQQFLDAVAVAMITPGPVVITVGFIGYLVAGLSGACLAALGTFLPCYLFTILPAPYFKKYGSRPGIVSFVDGVTAAAIGAICGAVIVLGRRTILDEAWQPHVPKIVILAATLGILVSGKKIPEPLIVLGAALVGLVIFPYVNG
ncbi:MAG: chromate transporter [Planctomycetia bacterium]|nr:chromate transporter [Planctomycetia bacterium]